MFTVSEWDTLTGYRETVLAACSVLIDISWRLQHGIPLTDLPEQYDRLKMDIVRFNAILEKIPDRLARNVLRCRFALGYTIGETAEFLEVSRGNIDNIIKKLKPSERNGIHEDNPIEH